MQDNIAPALVKVGAVDVEAFAKNLARMVEEGGKALAAYLKPREAGQIQPGPSDELTDMVKTIGEVAEYWLSDPQRAVELQSRLGQAYLDLWAAAAKRLAGEAVRRSSRPARRTGASPIRNGPQTSSSTLSSRRTC
jgi:polyhydroxyalkanoate synthase